METGARTWATPVLLIIAGAALVGLLALGQVPLDDNELEVALWLWVVALPAALVAACLTEWRADAQERVERATPLWGDSTTALNKTRTVQIVLGVVANVAVVAGYASFLKHFIPSAGVPLLVLAVVVAAAGSAVCWPGEQPAQDPKMWTQGAK
jgi:hypothetical protein